MDFPAIVILGDFRCLYLKNTQNTQEELAIQTSKVRKKWLLEVEWSRSQDERKSLGSTLHVLHVLSTVNFGHVEGDMEQPDP